MAKTSEVVMWMAIIVGLIAAIAGYIMDHTRGSVPGWIFIVIVACILVQVIAAISAAKANPVERR